MNLERNHYYFNFTSTLVQNFFFLLNVEIFLMCHATVVEHGFYPLAHPFSAWESDIAVFKLLIIILQCRVVIRNDQPTGIIVCEILNRAVATAKHTMCICSADRVLEMSLWCISVSFKPFIQFAGYIQQSCRAIQDRQVCWISRNAAVRSCHNFLMAQSDDTRHIGKL